MSCADELPLPPSVRAADLQRIIPHLWFDKAAEDAAKLYASLIDGSRVGRVTRYGKAGIEHHGQPEGKAMLVEFELGGFQMVGLNAGPIFSPTPAVSYFVMLESVAEVDRFWNGLASHGSALMPLGAYPWSERYGWLNDRYGMSWQVALGKPADTGSQSVTPSLLFTGERFGRAAEAVEFYTSVFPDSGVDGVLRNDGAGPEPAGSVMHAQFRILGSTFMAMDSSQAGDFAFTEANSHLILCEDQAEIDRYWTALSVAPEAEQCGWLRDRFGVSWQVVPRRMMEMMTDPDPEAVARVTEAFMLMKKLDIAALEAARAG